MSLSSEEQVQMFQEMWKSAGWGRPRRSKTDLTACVRGRIEFDEKASADASHKKFSDNKLPESHGRA